jgi:acetyltransferase
MRHYRESLLAPAAVIVEPGATDSHRLIRITEVLESSFRQPVLRDIEALVAPDMAAHSLAILDVPTGDVGDKVERLSRTGVPLTVVLGRHPRHTVGRRGEMRVIGPGSIGIAVPPAGLQALDGAPPLLPGRIAYVGHSASLARAIARWAEERRIGFSFFASLGAAADLDIAHLLDDLTGDARTQALVLQVSHIRDMERFVSAGRLAARSKPVVVLASGDSRGEEAPREDAHVLEAIYRRLGFVVTHTLEGLFAAAETLARVRRLRGPRVVCLTNSEGLVRLVSLAAETARETLGRGIRLFDTEGAEGWRDLGPGIPPQSLGQIAADALADRRFDAALVVRAPESDATADTATVAALIEAEYNSRGLSWPGKPLAVLWPGGAEGLKAFDAAGLPAFGTPAEAVRGLNYLLAFEAGRAALMETPAAMPLVTADARATAAEVIAQALAEGREKLSEDDIRILKDAYALARLPVCDRPPLLVLRLRQSQSYGVVIEAAVASPIAGTERVCEVILPPLTIGLARQHARRILAALGEGEADLATGALARAILAVSRLAIDRPEIAPGAFLRLGWNGNGWALTGAEVPIRPPNGERGRTAIRPYPSTLESWLSLPDGQQVFIRPVRAQDESQLQRFLQCVDREDFRLRFFSTAVDLSHAFLARLTQIDYAREMAFLAFDRPDGEILGVVHLSSDADLVEGEYAVLVRSDLKGHGLGWELMQRIIAHARSFGLKHLWGDVLAENATMLRMCRDLGFAMHSTPGDAGVVHVSLDLDRPVPEIPPGEAV